MPRASQALPDQDCASNRRCRETSGCRFQPKRLRQSERTRAYQINARCSGACVKRRKWSQAPTKSFNTSLKKVALPSPLRYQSPTMKQKFVLLLALTLCAWSPLFSATDTPEARRKEAERYLQVSPPKALFEDMADKMAANLPADQREQFKKLMTTQIDIAALSKAMTDAMVKNFTTEELKALADFYGSPVGKSAMQKFGAYMADVMPVVQAEIMKAAAKMNH